ncbi:ATP synthase subunit delta [bacterium BMS3Abin02]|nr:ATP synthase subunit delta [bacterium BMS3Abin02]GBE23292.1 ATP synthase subunit delta [bacterium BMS3Bbin01]HDL49864.1 ATP synthase F1 subunit delta [Actinomycetota bacterium]
MDERIAGYADAIFAIAGAEGQLATVEDEMFAVARAIEGSAELADALADPRLPAERKEAILADLLEGQASDLTTAFVRFVAGLGRARDLPAVADAFVARAAAERNRAVAEVRAAVPLDAQTLAKLEDALGKATGKNIEVKLVVDPSVLGGIVATIGDTVIDGSIRHRLESLRQTLQSR